MKIGIVSAQKHCKTHLRHLTQEGYEVYCLGEQPAAIPPSYDALIIRAASSSHQGVSVALEWGRTTGLPLIHENGLTGIRRALKQLVRTKTPTVQAQVTAEQMQECLHLWGTTLMEARPWESRGQVAQYLQKSMEREFPSMSANSSALVSSVLDALFNAATTVAAADVPTTTEEPPTMPPTAYPEQSLPFNEVGASWTKVYSVDKLRTAYDQAIALINAAPPGGSNLLTAFVQKSESGKSLPASLTKEVLPLFQGKPLMFVMFLHLGLPETHQFVKRALFQAYQDITKKGSDSRLIYAVSWFLDREHAHPVAKEAKAPPREETPEAKAVVQDNTTTILDLLDSVERIESQIKTLEFDDQECESEWKERFAAMKEDLRSDISDAFDALASEQQTPASNDLSSNPFAALEQVKAALKAAGFKGTLTLTIE